MDDGKELAYGDRGDECVPLPIDACIPLPIDAMCEIW